MISFKMTTIGNPHIFFCYFKTYIYEATQQQQQQKKRERKSNNKKKRRRYL